MTNSSSRLRATLCVTLSTLCFAIGCHGEMSVNDDTQDAADMAAVDEAPGKDDEVRPPEIILPGEDDIVVERPDDLPEFGEPGCKPPEERLWQLSPLQLMRTYRQLDAANTIERGQLRLEAYSVRGEPFSSDPALINGSVFMMSEVVALVRELSEATLDAPAPLDECISQSSLNAACVEQAIAHTAELLWRREPRPEELDELHAFYSEMEETYDAPTALRLTLRRVMIAPQVIYRSERGVLNEQEGVRELSSDEVADLIAYTLTDAPPDEVLREAARTDALRTPGDVRAHVRRLLAPTPDRDTSIAANTGEPQLTYGLMRFFREWLEVDAIEETIKPKMKSRIIDAYYTHYDSKDGELGKVPNEERAKRWLDNEMMLFVRREIWEGEGTLKALLSSDQTYMSKTLAGYYGFPLDMRPDGEVRQMAHGRRGLLMQGGFLLAHDTTSKRGLFIRSKLLCQDVPEPLDDVDMDLDGQAEALTMNGERPNPRDVRAMHLQETACSGCHNLIDPLAFPLDTFDDYGLERELWDGYPIDTKGWFTQTEALDGGIDDADDLIDALANSREVRACFVRQLFAYVYGRPPGTDDDCVLNQLTQRFEQSGGDIRLLMEEMLETEHTWHRTPRFDTP